jgi:hypothetical protein
MTRVHMKRRNKDKIYVVGKATSCETTFEGVRCLSFSRQYKVAIASNAPSEFDPNVLVATTAQCAKGTIVSWAPYLLNLFPEDCRYVQDAGIEFHFFCMLILIALEAWEKPKYSFFCDRRLKCGAKIYETL